MEETKKGYHITKKSKLYSIQKSGLEPRIGKRSNSVGEYENLLCFTDDFYSIFTWKNRLYENISFNDLAILRFDIPNNEYIRRYDSAGDCFIKDEILPENISVIQFIPKNEQQSENNLEILDNIFLKNSRSQAIEIMNENYEISMQSITELSIEESMLNDDTKRKVIEDLARYEHKKWSELYDIIDWKSKKSSDGSFKISVQDIDKIKKYIGINYDDVEEFHKKDIRKAVMETFFIMQENNVSNNFGISDEELISVLEETEYMRRNRWNEYMLSVCSIKDGEYFIPAQKAQLWKEKMGTPYNELTEEQKDTNRKETQNIFLEIQRYKSSKQNKTPLQEREDMLIKLEQEKEILESLIELSKQSKNSNIQR